MKEKFRAGFVLSLYIKHLGGLAGTGNRAESSPASASGSRKSDVLAASDFRGWSIHRSTLLWEVGERWKGTLHRACKLATMSKKTNSLVKTRLGLPPHFSGCCGNRGFFVKVRNPRWPWQCACYEFWENSK